MDTSQQEIVLRKAQSKAEKRDYLPQKMRKTQVCPEKTTQHSYICILMPAQKFCVFSKSAVSMGLIRWESV